MLIDLYKDPDVKRESPKVASRVYIKQPSRVEPRVWDSLELAANVREYFDELFRLEKRYVRKRNLQFDQLLPVELLCTGKNAKKMCVHIDLRERLDLVLASLCAVSPEKVRGVEHYEELSRGILDAAEEVVSPNLNLAGLLEIEEVLALFVAGEFVYDPSRFLSTLLSRCQDIVWYLSSYLCMRCIAKKQSAIRSIRPAESVIFTNMPVDDVMEIQVGDFVVPVKLESYEPFAYLKEVHL